MHNNIKNSEVSDWIQEQGRTTWVELKDHFPNRGFLSLWRELLVLEETGIVFGYNGFDENQKPVKYILGIDYLQTSIYQIREIIRRNDPDGDMSIAMEWVINNWFLPKKP